MSDIPPYTPPRHVDSTISGGDLAWLLSTGSVRGTAKPEPITMLTGVAGAHSGGMVTVSFPTAAGGTVSADLPYINAAPAIGDNVLVAQIDQLRVVLGSFA